MVAPIQWTEAMGLGIAEVDAQHRHLIELLNRLLAFDSRDQTSDRFTRGLTLFSERVHEHFRYEEELHRAADYPGREDHHAEHSAYHDRITALCQSSMGDSDALPRDLLEFLRGWWVEHLLHEDTKFRDFLAQPSPTKPGSGPAPSPADENTWFG